MMSRFGLSLVLAACAATPSIAADAQKGVPAFLQCVRQEKVTLVTAHRGGVVGGLAENSLEASAHTIANIPALLELDVQRTKDGVFVLMHDERIDRTTTGSGNVQEMTWDQLKDLNLRNYAGIKTPSRIPTLDEVLAWTKGRAVVQLDVKRKVPVDEVARKVLAAGAQNYSTIIVYNIEDALRVASVSPDIAMNVNISSPEDLARLEAAGISPQRIIAYTGNANQTAPNSLWDALEKKDVHIGFSTTWDEDMRIATTGNEAQYKKLSQLGVDLIVTDRHFEAFRAVEDADTRKKIASCADKSGVYNP